MRKTAVFKNPLFLEHNPGFGHPESSDRLAVLYEELKKPAIAANFLFPDFQPASTKNIELNHSAALISRVASTAGKPFDSLDPDTHTSALSYDAACLAVGSIIKGVDMLLANEADNCFALVRPPGHHAEKDQSMGFCIFNNIAVGAQYALKQSGLDRILIIDWDLHHGNGTQHAFYDTDKVLYFSTHQYPYYPGTGGLHETGVGKGEGYTINVPLRGGQDDRAYVSIFNRLVVPVARQYKPQMIMVSAGYDIYHGDPLGLMAVSPTGFSSMTSILLNLADELCGGKILFTLEGGYNLQGLKDGVLATLQELAGVSGMHDKVARDLEETSSVNMILEDVRTIAKKHWTL